MKKTLAMVALLLSTAAAPAQEWTGAYGGLTVGSGSGDYAITGSAATGTFESGAVYGVFAGYNLERNGMVYGAELAYQGADIPNQGFDGQGIDQLIDLKGRVGFSSGPSLVYGVIGYSSNRTFVPGNTSDGDGLAFGLGFDYQVKGKFIIGAEYLSRQMENDATSAIIGLEPDISTFSVRAGMKF